MSMQCIVATHNAHKLEEIRRILQPLGMAVVTDRMLGIALPEAEETGTTFAENALIKAADACRFTGLCAVADDSGLAVDALDGAPGVYSARYAGENATDADRMQKLLKALEGVPAEKRTARFVCAVCLVFPNGDMVTASGTCEGKIAFAPRGTDGFGYDPVFLPDAHAGKTFAELSAAEKDAISHRGEALRAFVPQVAAYMKTYHQ